MIKPTLGRIVWFTNEGHQSAAMICAVHGDRNVNLSVCGYNGTWRGEINVTLLQDDDKKPEDGRFAEWMPYQIGQAAKTPMKNNAGGDLSKI